MDNKEMQNTEAQSITAELYPYVNDPEAEKAIQEQFDQLEYHCPTPLQIAQIARIRSLYKQCALELAQMIPNSRERAVAFTENQRAMMMSVKAVVFS